MRLNNLKCHNMKKKKIIVYEPQNKKQEKTNSVNNMKMFSSLC